MTKNVQQIFFESVESLETVTFLSFIIPLLFLNSHCIEIFGMFTTDDSKYLLTLIKKAETELDLAKENYLVNITHIFRAFRRSI